MINSSSSSWQLSLDRAQVASIWRYEGRMISAFGTTLLLQYERDDGISDHQTWKRWIQGDFGVYLRSNHFAGLRFERT